MTTYRSTRSARSRVSTDHNAPPRLRRPGRALGLVVTGGQVSDFTGFEQVMAAIRYRFDKTSMAYRATVTIAALLQGATQ
jgi:hypothetical protein